MPGGINQIQFILLPILINIIQTDRLFLDRNASFPFKIHRIQDLRFHIPFLNSTGQFNETICQSRFPMVNMRNDAKISDVICIHNFSYRE